uniref:Nucleolar protein 4-like b n=1 Tax=Oryzias melastigma TaxID=30732 RepID=A0A3B3D8F5_ORYME
MHVETGADPGKTPKHAGQKKTYKAIAETYAFLPREAVTRFLMTCGECQKRTHQGAAGQDCKENNLPGSFVSEEVDYNLPITSTSMKMKQQLNSVSSEAEAEMSEPTWLAADLGRVTELSPTRREDRMRHSPLNAHGKEEDGKEPHRSSAEGTRRTSGRALCKDGAHTPADTDEKVAEQNMTKAPQKHKQRILTVPLPKGQIPDAQNIQEEGTLMRKTKTSPENSFYSQIDYGLGGSYDSMKIDSNAEDLSTARHISQAAPDDDDDDHDDHDDNDKINDTEGVDPERLKAFNMFVRLFVDENLDRMVPISKQPKEKIQAIIESCSRQFPEFQERARKRIRTYLKSCRRMKKNGMESRPTPPHLTSAMAENILAAACESESRNAAKRMRLEAYQDEPISLDKSSSSGAAVREPATLAHSAFSLAATAFSSPETQLYINGAGLSYGYRGYLGPAIQHPVSLTTATATQGPTDLSMKSLSSSNISNSPSSTANSLGGRGSGGGGASTQLSQPEITAVRQLIAGYRESAAFLLRSADELENLILQQN